MSDKLLTDTRCFVCSLRFCPPGETWCIRCDDLRWMVDYASCGHCEIGWDWVELVGRAFAIENLKNRDYFLEVALARLLPSLFDDFVGYVMQLTDGGSAAWKLSAWAVHIREYNSWAYDELFDTLLDVNLDCPDKSLKPLYELLGTWQVNLKSADVKEVS